MSIATTGVRIKAVIAHVAPEVMRRLAVPLAIRLDRLHLALQAAFGWTSSHLYAFHAGGASWGALDPDFADAMGDVGRTRLCDIVRDTGAKTIRYTYDFGDNWEHVIRLEKWVEDTSMEGLPLLLEAKGRCPPEDVGGPPGYEHFLAAHSDPAHPEHAAMRNWIGGDYDPDRLDRRALEKAVDALADKWRPKPRKPRSKTVKPHS
jgi:Plasmid pRiA4b ORF-3-like protein